MRKIPALLFLVFVLSLWVEAPSTRAQTAVPPTAPAQAVLYALDSSAFPSMTALLDVYDGSGAFVSGLETNAVTLREDNRVRALATLGELHPGAQFVLAFNLGPAFALRDSNGVTRMDKILRALQDWAAMHPADASDDISLVANGGTTVSHLQSNPALSSALAAFTPDVRSLNPTLDVLSKALDVSSEPAAQPGMKRAVLFISSLPDDPAIPTVQNLTDRAVQLQIHVSVWIVASALFFNTGGATALKDLAIKTGGQYALFSGDQPLPGPESYLAPLRHTYRLTYQSGISTSGSHTLSVQASAAGSQATSDVLTWNMDVQPPNPILVSPPEEIVRQVPGGSTTNLSALQPNAQSLGIIIEFPDNHPRALVQTSLLVDGKVVATNTSKPFDQFTWDLSTYTSSGQHSLQVMAVDSLGLSKTSLDIPVTITVVMPPRGLIPFLSRHGTWVALGAVLLAGLVLGVTLARSRGRRAGASSRRHRKDPLTQPVAIEQGRPSGRGARAGREKSSSAYLVRLKDDGQALTAPPIPIPAEEMTFGTDPTLATHVIDDASVSPLHARLIHLPDGGYALADEKSIAGTWVNYEQILEPRRLKHGDVIHLGRISYRFLLRKPPEPPEPRLTPPQP
jgi:hypothetical protein